MRYDLHHSQIISLNIYKFILKFIQFEVKFEQFNSLILRTLSTNSQRMCPSSHLEDPPPRRSEGPHSSALPDELDDDIYGKEHHDRHHGDGRDRRDDRRHGNPPRRRNDPDPDPDDDPSDSENGEGYHRQEKFKL